MKPLSPTSALPQNLHLGVAGWEDSARFAGLANGNRDEILARLAHAFDLIEITASYYQPLAPATTRRWLEQVQAHRRLRFTARLWQKLLRERSAQSLTEVQRFLAGLEPLVRAKRLAAVVASFSYTFPNSSANQDWLHWLADAFAGHTLVIELHHHSWSETTVCRSLLAAGLCLAHVDQPRPGRAFVFPLETPGRVAYARFDGRNLTAWLAPAASRDDRHDYLYSEAELAALVSRVKTALARTSLGCIVFNNYPRGQGLINALQLQALLGGAPVPAAGTLRQQFPFLHRGESN
ncbi:MAG: DUF72 domain-containing protein [candidate division KSB1 bacterium]|nr:DUF72 domain-containing protein [candidate division KSB1 bacterium]MDZ7275220.1 DUF72 domain-containing protein [candidate division KSB1 bacterium]MDZ7287389.1 DUF72 domain-containing protein [candidate division KSB1 bacterium]MDZ7299503.1 DUF72 domain-containing protein [candidate division KSB1 bacterium]MDZ7305451.1 DUF72 domain-containing protein [candidate division KSB1 bacterium]